MRIGITKLLATTALVYCSLAVQAPQAQARNKQLTFEVPVESQTAYRDVIHAVEISAQAEISQQFRNHPDISTLQISVLVERNGDIIPVFGTTVSRAQWEQQPKIEQWAKYHDSYALIKRHDYGEGAAVTLASAPMTSKRNPAASSSSGYDSTFDRGRLPPRVAQSSLDYWD